MKVVRTITGERNNVDVSVCAWSFFGNLLSYLTVSHTKPHTVCINCAVYWKPHSALRLPDCIFIYSKYVIKCSAENNSLHVVSHSFLEVCIAVYDVLFTVRSTLDILFLPNPLPLTPQ